ncbi:hypothetical protein I5860_000925 [Clostridioides difficile]
MWWKCGKTVGVVEEKRVMAIIIITKINKQKRARRFYKCCWKFGR